MTNPSIWRAINVTLKFHNDLKTRKSIKRRLFCIEPNGAKAALPEWAFQEPSMLCPTPSSPSISLSRSPSSPSLCLPFFLFLCVFAYVLWDSPRESRAQVDGDTGAASLRSHYVFNCCRCTLYVPQWGIFKCVKQLRKEMRNFNFLFDLHSFFLDCTFYRVSASRACTYFHFFLRLVCFDAAINCEWLLEDCADDEQIRIGAKCKYSSLGVAPSHSLSLPLPGNTHRIIIASLCNHHYSALIEASALNRYCQIAQCSQRTEQVICGKHSSLSICRRCLGCLKVPTNLDHNQSYQSLLMPHVVQARLEWFREITAIADEIYIHNRGLSEACRS